MTWDEHIRAEGASMRWTFAEPHIRELEAKVAALEALLVQRLEGEIVEGERRAYQYVLDQRKQAITALEAENGRLRAERRATLEAVIDECSAEKVYAITGRMLTAYRAQPPNPAQDKGQG